MLVVPGFGGLSIYAPKMNNDGVSIPGLIFCGELVKKYNFHHFESPIKTQRSVDTFIIDLMTKIT